MSDTLTEHVARHGGGWCDPEHSRLDDYTPRHAALCYRCATDPIDALEPDPTYCRACLDEIAHAADARRYDAALAAFDAPERAL